jgi:hypothetical protein
MLEPFGAATRSARGGVKALSGLAFGREALAAHRERARVRPAAAVLAILLGATGQPPALALAAPSASTSRATAAPPGCDERAVQLLEEASNRGRDVQNDIQTSEMREPTSVYDLACLDKLFGADLNLFGSIPSWDKMLDSMKNYACQVADQKIDEYTAPIQQRIQQPGFTLPPMLGGETISAGGDISRNGTGDYGFNNRLPDAPQMPDFEPIDRGNPGGGGTDTSQGSSWGSIFR